MASEYTNIGLQIDPKINDKLSKAAPRGLKAEAIRALIVLLIQTQEEWVLAGKKEFVVDKLLRGQCKLVVISD